MEKTGKSSSMVFGYDTMKFLHRLVHWLNLHSTFYDMYVENDWVYICRRCNTCNKPENIIQMWPEKNTENILAKINGSLK